MQSIAAQYMWRDAKPQRQEDMIDASKEARRETAKQNF